MEAKVELVLTVKVKNSGDEYLKWRFGIVVASQELKVSWSNKLKQQSIQGKRHSSTVLRQISEEETRPTDIHRDAPSCFFSLSLFPPWLGNKEREATHSELGTGPSTASSPLGAKLVLHILSATSSWKMDASYSIDRPPHR